MSGAAVVDDVEGYFPCRWDWCRAVFTSLKEGMEHVVVQHINTAPLLTRAEIKLAERLEADHPFSMSEGLPGPVQRVQRYVIQCAESWLTSTPRPSQQVQPPMSTQQTLSQSQSQSQPSQLLSPPRLSDALPESPGAQSPSASASGSATPPSPPKPRASTSRAPLVGYSSRTSSPAPEEPTIPALSFAALSGAGDPTPPLQRLPASPTSEEQIYRHLDLDAHAESQSDESVSAAARKRKEPPPSTPKQRAKTVSVAGTPLRRSSRHSTPSVADTPKSKATPKSKQTRKRHKAGADSDGELDDDANLPAIREMEEGEIMSSPPSQLQSQSQSQQPQSEQSQSQSQAQSQSQSQWPSLTETQTQSLNLATQMPLSQESFEWNLSQ